MRSTPTLILEVRPAVVHPGDKVRVRLLVTSASETPASGLSISLVSKQRRFKEQETRGSSKTNRYHVHEVLEAEATYPGRTLTPGTHEFVVDFTLPTGIPPSYESRHSSIAYAVLARVDVPWWFGAETEQSVVVIAPPLAATKDKASPSRFENTRGPDGKKLYIECSLASDEVPLGGVVEGAFSLGNLAFNIVDRVEVDVVAVESARVKSDAGPTVTWRVPGGTLLPGTDGEVHRFSIAVAPPLPPSFRSRFIEVEHSVRIRAVVRRGFDQELFVPLVISPADSDVPVAVPIALVGRAKQSASWSAAAQAAAESGASVVATDAEGDELRLHVEGMPIVVGVKGTRDGNPRLVATLDHPDLGLGLEVVTRTWSDMRRGLPLPADTADALAATAREAAQAGSFLTPELIAWLCTFDRVAVNDAEAIVSVKGSSHKRKELVAFVERVVRGAALLSSARAAIPPPGGFDASHVAAYRAFAAARDAELRIGDMRLGGLREAGLVIDVEHDLLAERAPGKPRPQPFRSSRVVYRAPGRELAMASATASLDVVRDAAPSQRGAFQLLEDAARGAVIVTTPPIVDPSVALRELEPITSALARSIGPDVGPYRR